MTAFIDVADWLARLWALAFVSFVLWLVYGETRRSIARTLQRRADVEQARTREVPDGDDWIAVADAVQRVQDGIAETHADHFDMWEREVSSQ